MGKSLKDLGWYQDPDDVHYRRFWDGHRWTESRGRATTHPARVKIRRLANLGALVCLAIFLAVTFLPSSQDGLSCGTWVAPKLNALGLATKSSQLALAGGGTFDQFTLQAAAHDCTGHLATMRLIAIGALIVGLALRWGLPYAFREEFDQ